MESQESREQSSNQSKGRFINGPQQRSAPFGNDQISGRVKSAVSASQNQETKSAKEEYKRKLKEKAEQENSNLWQHPFVDIFKHFKVIPASDWKLNKKQGDVEEYFAKEIGRRAFQIEGTISANNYIQVPHSNSMIKSLGLTGRYLYLQVKCPRHGLPFSYHLDLGIAERSHGIRISVSNLFKNFTTSNGFVAQVPLELKNNCWSVIVLDIYEILKKSQILPSTYLIDGCYQIRSINVCANTHVRGIYTSENLYDFVTLPADMRFKFAFDLGKWPEFFNWQQLPQDWEKRKDTNGDLVGDENLNLQNLIDQQKNNQKNVSAEEQRKQMRQEIDIIMEQGKPIEEDDYPINKAEDSRKMKYEDMQRQLKMQFNAGEADHPVNGYIIQDEFEQRDPSMVKRSKSGGTGRSTDYRGGLYSGMELSRSHKLNKDPIMELKHIIGYQADKCHDIKWSRTEGENVILFTSGGTLIAMDTELNQQKRFFFGHSAPICCFDLNKQGNMIASAQEEKGKNSMIRIWDYATARCITMMTMPVVSMKCLSFSQDGRYLASVGKAHYFMRDKKDPHNKELIIIWDVSKVQKGEKPEIVSKQTSDYNILDLKFSPIDPTRLASCGFENIRLWRIRDSGNIRGSTVVLNNHARNTVFTCLDFEYGFRAADKNENESLKRIFVGSKHGMVFQVNYQSEALEATYKTNDGAIYSISVNDAFCVIGSEDTYLRVWPLDFSEFFIEAQHEGTVSAVDISNDGLKVVCGTLYGSIGIVDKSNKDYKTLLRSHIDEIIALDFHLTRGYLITASRDKTIRLWDVESFEEVHEFTSQADQPLSLSCHPTLSIFACGFESGKMIIFDMNTAEETPFSQFNKPLKSLKYDNNGKYLVACCADGSVSIHNAARQHLPIKMMHLEMPPEFVHVAFTDRLPYGYDISRQRFGVMGEYGNNIILYDTESFLVQNQILVQNVVKLFKFANNNNDLLVVTKDCKIKFYSLMKYEGIFLREISNCHRGSISGIDVSQNSGYLLTGGQDNMVKIWDYEAQKTVSYYFQSFIGHTYPITAIIFNPRNNGQIISVSERDGIFIWDFNGDIESDYKAENLSGQDLQSLTVFDEKAPSMLEKIRTLNKAKKQFRNQMREDSFFVPQFKAMEQCTVEKNNYEFIDSPNFVKQQRADRKLTYNHYANCSKKIEIEIEQATMMSSFGDSRQSIIEQKLINGYDGFGGVHDNLIWNSTGGLTFFTLNNKFIIEELKERKQYVFADSSIQLSCIASTVDSKIIAVAEGSQNPQGSSLIYLYDTEKKKFLKKLTFHIKGVQSMAFTLDSRFLITLGVQGENNIAIFDIQLGIVVKHGQINKSWANQLKIDHYSTGPSHIQFMTVGNNAQLIIWRFDIQNQNLINYEAAPPNNIANLNFLSLDFTPVMPEPVGTQLVVIGTDDGSLIAYDQKKESYVDLSSSRNIIQGQIGAISIKSNSVVIGSSKGIAYHYPLYGPTIQPEDLDMIDRYDDFNSAIVSITMDEFNKEGLIGTEAGQIFYVNFAEKIDSVQLPVRLVSSNNKNQDAVSYCKFDVINPKILVTNCGQRSDDFKMFTNDNCDEVRRFQSNLNEDGFVVFVLNSQVARQKYKRIIGFSNGVLKRANFQNLDFEHVFKLPLNSSEKLTCGFYSENGQNILVGTNHGTLFIISLQEGKRNKRSVDASYARIENIGRCNTFETEEKQIKTHTKLNSDIINDTESIDIDRVDSQQDLTEYTGITMIRTPFIDPIGTLLISFDDGTIKIWQSSKNKQVIRILELQQAIAFKKPKDQPQSAALPQNKPAIYDIAEFGYQQFDQIDNLDLFKNPHNDEQTEADRQQLKQLFSGKKYDSCQARFAPGTTKTDQYYCLVDALQYFFIRDFQKHEIIKKINLDYFPTSMAYIEFSKIILNEDSSIKDALGNSKGNILIALGTKEGRVVVYRLGGYYNLLFQTKAGISFGGITAIDIQSNGSLMVAATETGEMMFYDLLNKLNEQ